MKQSTKYLKILCNLLLAVFVLFVFFFILPRVLVYFLPFVIGYILSLIANPPVHFLEKKLKIARKSGTVLIIVAVIALIVLGCYGIGALLVRGLTNFSEQVPSMYENAAGDLSSVAQSLQNLLNSLPFVDHVDLSSISSSVGEYFSGLIAGNGSNHGTVGAIGNVARSIPDIIVYTIVGFLATYFFIADRDKLLDWLRSHLPEEFYHHAQNIYRQMKFAVGGYFKAQFKIMGVIYVVVTIGLLILRVDFAWLIGFGIAFLDMLPVFGTGTVLCPWAVVKLLTGDYSVAVGMLILYAVTLVVHQAVQPKLVGDSVGMNTFAALFFMYIGYKVSGVLGMIIAIPVGMILINLYRSGAFDNIIWCIKELVNDFNRFRKIRKW
jgi:sporulation integral membrane protein YtvI